MKVTYYRDYHLVTKQYSKVISLGMRTCS